jgi:uncharacterized membrane protein YfcA
MPEQLLAPLLLFLAGFAAGTVNVIAGGGSMLTLPLMIFLGLPPTVANGTNRVAILLQNVGVGWAFHRRRKIPSGWLRWIAPPAVVGVVAGGWTAIVIGDEAFQRILALVLMGMVVVTLWKRPQAPEYGPGDPPTSGRSRALLVTLFFFIGFYGGFIQAGVGFVVLAAFAGFGLDLVRGNALKAIVILIWTVPALALFSSAGKVDWSLGLALAAGNVVGGQLGVHLTVLKGQAWVQKVVAVMVVVFAIRLLLVS